MRTNKTLVFCLLLLIVLSSCNNSKVKEARQKAESLWMDIENGTADKDFPQKHFPEAELKPLLLDLKNKCDFKTRKGGFVKEIIHKDLKTSIENVSFVFDYYMKCDTIRFTLTYNLQNNVELYEFRIDPIE